MKLNISHPGESSMQFVSNAIDKGETLYRSPHVGNLRSEDLGLILGLGEMDADVQLELVDTIRGSDNYSQPRVAIVGLKNVVLASNKHAGRVVGRCEAKPEGVQELKSLGISVAESDKTLKQLHINSLKQVLPDNVQVTPSTEFFGRLDGVVYETILRESMNVLDRSLRCVNESGKINQAPLELDFSNIYGLGENPNEGLLPPLEAMMAIEVIKKILESEGQDNQIVHIAGADMIRYTKDISVMQPVEDIVNRVLSDLGVSDNLYFDYVVPGRQEVLQSKDFDTTIGDSVNSQYDILVYSQVIGEQDEQQFSSHQNK